MSYAGVVPFKGLHAVLVRINLYHREQKHYVKLSLYGYKAMVF